ncbi:terminase small subunit [Novispirillum itersonii]|uniref:terminase small subunit n=1 Tax=Novispirillum itersonii TaxID=189 RepID=UPI0003706AB0|nr:terminase small subunit [Novispirillum itersonii]
MAPRAMSAKARRFVDEYMIDLNATQAAIRAGYSARSAKTQGSHLMTRPEVQAAVAAAQAGRSRRTEITADRVVEELARVAFFDLRRVFRPDGALIPVADLPEDVAAALAAVDLATVGKGEGAVEHIAKIKTADKLRALENLARHLGMFRERVEVSGPGGGPVEVSALTPAERAARVQALIDIAAARGEEAENAG